MRTPRTHTSSWFEHVKQHLAAMFVVRPSGTGMPHPTTEQITALRDALYSLSEDRTPAALGAKAGTSLQRGRRALA